MVETEPDDSSDQEIQIEYDESSSDDDTFDFDIHEGVVEVAESHALYTTLANVDGGQTIKTEGAAVCDRDSDEQ